MNEPRISAKQVLKDIRAGMDEKSLMKKYKFSAKTLQDLFSKLGKAGFIKYLNAREVIVDLRSGISIQNLMKKYCLTAEGLASLFQELDRSGLLRGISEQGSVPSKLVINIHQIAEDIRSGLTETQLMQKYHLSPRGLGWVSMTLVTSGTIALQEIYDNLNTSYEDLVPDKLRQTRRYPISFNCTAYEPDNPGVVGKVRDISENGLGIMGLKADMGDAKTLIIPGDEFGEFTSFTFDSTCRWITKDPNGVFVAGFEISHISIRNLKEFELLLHLVEFGNRDKQFF